MATILEILQDTANELAIREPALVVQATDTETKQLLATAHRAGKEARQAYQWPELSREALITLVADQASYALPTDLDWTLFQTHWDRSNTWELVGPLSAQRWQWRKSGVSTVSPRREFRVKSSADKQLFFNPTPETGDAGAIMVFEYQSTNWIRPRTWVTGETYTLGEYTFYDGNYYTADAAGTTGATAPTHTTGSASDDNISWTYYSGKYEKFLKDTDVSILDADCMVLDIKWRYLRSRGLDFQAEQQESMIAWRRQSTTKKSAPILDLTTTGRAQFLSPGSIPDTGYGS